MTLSEYLSTNKITQAAFAESIGATQQAVGYWVGGERCPQLRLMQRIVDATNGAVTPNDFLLSMSPLIEPAPPVSEPQEAAE